MNAPIIYIGGSKGGVGKSMVTFALIEYLLRYNKPVLLIETDNANPDVHKAHSKHISADFVCQILNLDCAEGWIELVNTADTYPEHTLVINSAARSDTGIKDYGATLRDTLQELNRKLLTLWVINRQRDSIELLYGFIGVFPDARIHVCRNLHFGVPEKFERYNTSKVRETLEEQYQTLDFPDLADRVADKLYSGRQSIQQALQDLPIGDRAELRRWQQQYSTMFTIALAGE